MRRQRRLAFVLAAVAAAVSLAAAPAQAAEPVDYVALGDSYSSGTGAPPYQSGSCYRSSRSYAQLWADTHAVSSFAFVACGGATTDDLGPQLDALRPETDLVTITIGGNDVGFFDVVLTCILGSDRSCTDAVDRAAVRARTELPGKLDRTYASVAARAPGARLVVLGYPRLVEQRGWCLSSTKRAALNRGADELAGIIADRAAAAGATYVDARQTFAGHGACGWSPWVNGPIYNGLVETFHPNAAGYSRGYLTMLNSVTG
ncbi:SGNH/GDSL hydrolase family protein [Thalassiella azotivora]